MDSYEKKYKEALEKARQLCAYPTSKPFISDLQDLFPELTESNDERIRKELIDAILGLWDNDALPMPLSVKRKDEWIAWLEKQGEPTDIPADAVLDSNKDGLIADTIRCKIEKQGEQKAIKVPKFKVGDFIQFNGVGHTRYTVKEVCGLSHYINTCNKRMDMSYTDANFELVEQNTAEWSEEDEKLINSIIELIDNGALDRDEKDYFIEKLKSLRPQSQWKPSDEQIFALQGTLPVIKGRGTYQQSLLESLYEDLKKLKG